MWKTRIYWWWVLHAQSQKGWSEFPCLVVTHSENLVEVFPRQILSANSQHLGNVANPQEHQKLALVLLWSFRSLDWSGRNMETFLLREMGKEKFYLPLICNTYSVQFWNSLFFLKGKLNVVTHLTPVTHLMWSIFSSCRWWCCGQKGTSVAVIGHVCVQLSCRFYANF